MRNAGVGDSDALLVRRPDHALESLDDREPARRGPSVATKSLDFTAARSIA